MPYYYHNRTFWPWITGIEMLASSRFRRFEECNILLSKLASEDDLHLLTFYEGVNPISGDGGGSYPFRTVYAL
jgi:glycogen debranching enzyme